MASMLMHRPWRRLLGSPRCTITITCIIMWVQAPVKLLQRKGSSTRPCQMDSIKPMRLMVVLLLITLTMLITTRSALTPMVLLQTLVRIRRIWAIQDLFAH